MSLWVIGLVAALISAAAAADLSMAVPSMISTPNANGPSYDFHYDSCPNLRRMVHVAVEKALTEDIGVAAGLLQIIFHDCFPQGCDASVLLVNQSGSEMNMPPNSGLRPNALQLIEDIRVNVHAACGATVSCTDILNLATREALTHFWVPRYDVPLGLLDSPWPATLTKVYEMPLPDFNASQLIKTFGSHGFDAGDVVALSGAHTIGRSRCSEFKDRFGENSEFARRLQGNCSRDPDRLQDLDVTTPEWFDNEYYRNLLSGEGVFTSDMKLLENEATNRLVNRFAEDQARAATCAIEDQGLFFSQFGTSMSKMSHLPSQLGDDDGEIRKYSCFRANSQGPDGPTADTTASA